MWLSVTLQILVALAIFVLSQWFVKFVLEPIHSQKTLIGRIACAITLHANVHWVREFDEETDSESKQNKLREIEDTKRAIRHLSGELHQSLWEVPLYGLMARLKLVRSKKDILTAASKMIGWSNNLYNGNGLDHERHKEITRCLGIDRRIY